MPIAVPEGTPCGKLLSIIDYFLDSYKFFLNIYLSVKRLWPLPEHLSQVIASKAVDFFKPSFDAVEALLVGADLPVEDLPPDLEHFLGCGEQGAPDGVVGLEVFGEVALLRSLVVAKSFRGRGLGTRLVAAAEDHARNQEVHEIFLLTDTAEQFFRSLGYESADRAAAPASIRSTAQFTELCPATAAFMSKRLRFDRGAPPTP